MRIIFSDLDGTLLDHDTYSYDKAEKALDYVKTQKIPLIICSSKTSSEIKFWRKKIGNEHPFISENGGGIFIPNNYFSFDFQFHKKTKNYVIIELGVNYEKLAIVLKELKNKFEIISFDEMSEQEIANDANIPYSQAILSKKREYDIPFKLINQEQEHLLLDEIKKRNFKCVIGGRYYHLIGDNDKGKAVKILMSLFKKKFNKPLISIGIGDSENDFSMLDAVDKPFLVKKKDGYASEKYQKAEGIGPDGWSYVIHEEWQL